MKHSKLYTLLLASTILVGCGDTNTDTSKATLEPITELVQPSITQQTDVHTAKKELEQAADVGMETYQTQDNLARLKWAFARLSAHPLYKEDAGSREKSIGRIKKAFRTEQKEYISQFYNYRRLRNQLKDKLAAAQLAALNDIPRRDKASDKLRRPGAQYPVFINPPAHGEKGLSWIEMHDTVRRLETISLQLNTLPDVVDEVDKLVGGKEDDLVCEIVCSGYWPRYQEKEHDFFKTNDENTTLRTNDRTLQSIEQSEREKYESYSPEDYRLYSYYRAGPSKTTMLTNWIREKLKSADFDQARKSVKSLWTLGDSDAQIVLARVTRNALLKQNFQDDEGERGPRTQRPLIRRVLTSKIYTAFPNGDLTHQFLVDKEKEVIAAMLKTGLFNGLFDYLKDKAFEINGVQKVVFTSAEFDALVPVATSLKEGSALSSAAARKGLTGANTSKLMVNGMQGTKLGLNFPVYVELNGQLDAGKTTSNLSATTSYKLGNTTFSVNHTYANSGEGFKQKSNQQETNVAISQSFGAMFIEGSMGYMSADQVHYQDWSGSQYQLTIGMDTQVITPYVQFAYRDLTVRTDNAGYLGVNLNLDTLKADSYTFDLTANAYVGYQQYKGVKTNLEFKGNLNLNNGVKLSTNLALGTSAHTQAGFNISLDR